MALRLFWTVVLAMVSSRRLLFAGLAVLFSAAPAWCGDAASASKEATPALTGQALILVGLPGDEEHDELFAYTVKQWREWLTGVLGFSPGEVRVLSGGATQTGVSDGVATREAIEKEAARLKKSLRSGDRLWVFFLGHANFDGEHAWFHLPGPDLRDDDLGKLFADVKCREQIFWMTTSESGRFVKILSGKGRIVMAATRTQNEDNETEFPHAITKVAKRPLAELDVDGDGKLSVLELYYRIVAEVQTLYATDERIPTEHSQLDDNGDGVGTERPLVADKGEKTEGVDGILSAGTILPYRDVPLKAEKEEPKAEKPKAEKAEPLEPIKEATAAP
jgi:hypothetical protein